MLPRAELRSGSRADDAVRRGGARGVPARRDRQAPIPTPKRDAPSGTAKATAARVGTEPAIHSVRLPGIVAHQEVRPRQGRGDAHDPAYDDLARLRTRRAARVAGGSLAGLPRQGLIRDGLHAELDARVGTRSASARAPDGGEELLVASLLVGDDLLLRASVIRAMIASIGLTTKKKTGRRGRDERDRCR